MQKITVFIKLPEAVHDSRELHHEVFVLVDAMSELAAVSRSEGEYFTVGFEVSLFKLSNVVDVVLSSIGEHGEVILLYLLLEPRSTSLRMHSTYNSKEGWSPHHL